MVEDDDFIQPIDEFRIEGLPHLGHNHFFQLIARRFSGALESHGALLLNEASSDIRRHDDDGVLEVDGVAERVGKQSIFKDLQQDVEDVRVRLFDFVEKQTE